MKYNAHKQKELIIMMNKAKPFYYTLLLCFLIFSLATQCYCQKDNTNDAIFNDKIGNLLDKKLTPYVKNLVDEWGLPSMVVGVISDNNIVYANAFGYENIETKKPATIRSLYKVASISKTFVATAIMQLVEQEKIALDSPVVKYLPYFKLDDSNYEKITIKQMLNHTSGMPDVLNFQYDKPEYDEGALERYVRSLDSIKTLSKSGRNYLYSNMAYECLGDVIAKTSGMSFEDYMQKHILTPSGMTESSFHKPHSQTKNWATPYLGYVYPKANNIYPYNRRHSPSGDLHSNVIDMCNWAIINMNYGCYNYGTILDSASYKLLWKPSEIKTDIETNIGLSWFLSNYKGEKTVEHSGNDLGYSAYFLMLPNSSQAVVVLSNVLQAPVEEVTVAALNIIFGYEPETFDQPTIVPFIRKMEEYGMQTAVDFFNSIKNKNLFEYELNDLGYKLLKENRTKEAIEVFKLNAKEFPSSWNVYDSLGEAYIKNGNTDLAIKNYKKSVRLNPNNENGKKVLETLLNK